MRLAYVDESYNRDFYFLGALVVDDACVLSIGKPNHGHAIFHGKDGWAPLRSKVRARIAVYDQALQAIGAHDVRILLCGIDRRETPESAPIHDVVLSNLLRRLNYFGQVVGEPILIIADEVGEQDRHRLSLRNNRGPSFLGHPALELRYIVDTLHFAPSRHSRFIQAIDLVTFLHCRRARADDSSDPRATKVNDLLWSRIADRIHESRMYPKDRTSPQSTKAPR